MLFKEMIIQYRQIDTNLITEKQFMQGNIK